MLLIKALHLIAMVAWFAGLFYLPRLFVYHSESQDPLSLARFKVMERRLYYGITYPAGIATSLFGMILMRQNLEYFRAAGWMQLKLVLIVLLWAFHLSCGYYRKQFALDKQAHGTVFFRVYNEVPTLLLIGIILLAVLKP